jgi:crossover junction endodeoxyribonuclease RusA
MIELPYPHKALWPNGRSHFMAKAREAKKHRAWAKLATLAANDRPATVSGLIVTVYPKPTGPLPDKDNACAAVKAYQDGIAEAYGLDDRTFGQPRIQFGERCPEGKFVITIEGEARSIGDIVKPIMSDIVQKMERQA